MTSKYDQCALFKNITAMQEIRGMKTGELEKKAGLSQGYIARATKAAQTGKSTPSVETIWKIAKALNVNIECLIEGIPNQGRHNLSAIVSFVERLIEQTREEGLRWRYFTIGEINFFLKKGDVSSFPAIEDNPSGEQMDSRVLRTLMGGGSDMVDSKGSFRLRSFTRPGSWVMVAETCFNADLPNGQRIHLIPFAEEILEEGESEEDYSIVPAFFYEMVFEDLETHQVQPICNTLSKGEALMPVIQKLRSALEAQMGEIPIAPPVYKLIDRYMELTAPDNL